MKIAVCQIGKEDCGELLPLLLFERARSCIKRGCAVLAIRVDGLVKGESASHLQRICDEGGLICFIADLRGKTILKPGKSPTHFAEDTFFLNDLAAFANPTWLCLRKEEMPPHGDVFLLDGGCFCFRDGKPLCSVPGSGAMLIKACA